MSQHRFEIPRRFDPTRSVLGCFLSRNSDALQAEARYYFAAVMIVIGILIANFLAWAILKPTVMDEPLGTVALLYWTAQVSSVAGFLALCVVGFQRSATITVNESSLSVARGQDRITIRRSDIEDHKIVTPLAFHRHYRRYSNVSSYAVAGAEAYVIIRPPERVLAIGLQLDDARDVLDTLNSEGVTRRETVRVAL